MFNSLKKAVKSNLVKYKETREHRKAYDLAIELKLNNKDFANVSLDSLVQAIKSKEIKNLSEI